ncbi:hypothetical protein chiPu_0032608, partial [Chiloscyllium punctatum]|nr:hypothetical protein [Chiloscyllium punctatum]
MRVIVDDENTVGQRDLRMRRSGHASLSLEPIVLQGNCGGRQEPNGFMSAGSCGLVHRGWIASAPQSGEVEPCMRRARERGEQEFRIFMQIACRGGLSA